MKAMQEKMSFILTQVVMHNGFTAEETKHILSFPDTGIIEKIGATAMAQSKGTKGRAEPQADLEAIARRIAMDKYRSKLLRAHGAAAVVELEDNAGDQPAGGASLTSGDRSGGGMDFEEIAGQMTLEYTKEHG